MRLAFLLLAMLAIPFSASADTATFAGGCFWCMDAEFSRIKGVTKVVSGFTGGTVKNPSYKQVSTGTTGNVESIQVTYDPALVSYRKLLDIFWGNIDPTDENGQFCDKGSQYRAGIFYHNQEQKMLAEESKDKVKGLFKTPIATTIEPAGEFYPAEDYHQDYYKKNPSHYQAYHAACGRDEKLGELWKGKQAPFPDK